MGTSDEKTKHSQGADSHTSRILFGLLITIIVVLGVIIWNLKAHQMNPAQDPNWVALSEVQPLRKQLAQEKKTRQKLQHRNQQLVQQLSGLQRQIARQSSESEHTIPLSRLPQELRGDSVPSTLAKLQKLQHQADTPHPDAGLMLSYFALLDHLQTKGQGVVNTAEPASDPVRQALYRHIQAVLKSLGVALPAGQLQAQTHDGVTRFQSQQKLKVDGKIGMQTFMAMVRKFQHQSETSSNPQPPAAPQK